MVSILPENAKLQSWGGESHNPKFRDFLENTGPELFKTIKIMKDKKKMEKKSQIGGETIKSSVDIE